MTPTELSYVVFGVLLVLAIIFDLGLLSKKGKEVSLKQAFYQTIFWVLFGTAYGVFMWFEDGPQDSLEYLSAYLMEWGLSIDNIFVFILIFAYFKIPDKHSNRVLLYGILLAIILRVVFISLGIILIAKFHWVLYIFGGILVATGIKMFSASDEQEFDAENNAIYKILKVFLPLTKEKTDGKFVIRKDGKKYYTPFFVVLIILASTDIVFALDSIPAVFAITQNKMVIYTSNIFAVLGLRSLFFLLKGAVNKFEYLHEGIAIVLVFIGIKMLITFFDIHIHIAISLAVIVLCLGGSILFSLYKNKQKAKHAGRH